MSATFSWCAYVVVASPHPKRIPNARAEQTQRDFAGAFGDQDTFTGGGHQRTVSAQKAVEVLRGKLRGQDSAIRPWP